MNAPNRRTLSPERLAKMQAARGKPSPGSPQPAHSPLKAIRAKCLDCHCGSSNSVKFCPSDGLNCPTACSLWPFRFGKRPISALKGPLAPFLNPKLMPAANVPLEDCQYPVPEINA